MEQYKQEFIEFMVESEVLKFGEFTLKSGRKSPFFMNAGAYVTGEMCIRDSPTMLPLSHQLATVDGVYNAIYVTGDAVGETMFFGEGAGAGPAASAVMGLSLIHI